MQKKTYWIIGGASVVILATAMALNSVQPIFEPSAQVAQPVYDVKLSDLSPIDSLKSPLILHGEAQGSYFENGSFPVDLVGEDGVVIARGIASTQADTSTDDYVPFVVTITFPKQTQNTMGQLVFHKANSSGDTTRSYEFSVPVRF
jgi:hypothetical protein